MGTWPHQPVWVSAIYLCSALLSVSKCRSVTSNAPLRSLSTSSDSRYSSNNHHNRRIKKKFKYIPIHCLYASSSSESSSDDDCCRSLENNNFLTESDKSSSSESMVLIRIPKKYLVSLHECRCKKKCGPLQHHKSHTLPTKSETTRLHTSSSIKSKTTRLHTSSPTESEYGSGKYKKSLKDQLTTENPEVTKNYIDLSKQVKTQEFQKTVNELFDKALEQYRQMVKTTGRNSIKFEDLNSNFSMSFFGYEVHGSIHASDGKLQGLETLYRSGDVNTKTDNRYLYFTMPLVIRNMIIDFGYCGAMFMRFKKQGTAKGHVGHNLITVELAVSLQHDCSVHVNKVELTDFSKLTLEMKGLGLLDNFHKRAANSIMTDHAKKYRHGIENRLTTVLRTVFESTDFHEHIRENIHELKGFGML